MKFENDLEICQFVIGIAQDMFEELNDVNDVYDFDLVGRVQLVETTQTTELNYDGYGEIPCHRVVKLLDHNDVLVMLSGHYSSYNGTDLDTAKIVKPVIKTITVYE